MWSFVFGSLVPERYSKKIPSLNFKSILIKGEHMKLT